MCTTPYYYVACLYCFVNQEPEIIRVHTYIRFRKRRFLPQKPLKVFSTCLKWSLFGRLSIGDACSPQYLSRVELAESTEMTPQQGNKIIFVLFLLQLHFHSTNQMNFQKSCMHPLLILSQLTKLYSPQFPSSSGSMSKLSNH